ncbi:DUF1266 domain-containing protein [Tenacibaculum jejuense]|uniref:DUF1266 domain-containing protein n=1 Tax=Tenacibaculum jejuense TaxID=584609 RepID=A0A238UBB4_9FLAO|nr:DUF1266 domain-containing protein [Tenacibaculum jejuense]SNR16266.1 protein of unknown function [Tenacibaculum jejuense]
MSKSNITLSESQKRKLVFGAILSYYRGESILDTTLSGDNEEYIEGLVNWWGITNTEEAKSVLGDLLALKKSTSINVLLETPDAELNAIKSEIAEGLDIHFSEVNKVTDTYAWDIVRLIVVSKYSYWSSYITEEEMWDFISYGAERATEIGTDWKQYTISFLLGRCIHGFDLEDVIDECKELYYSKQSMLSWVFRVKNLDVYKKFSFK